ncbi:MAG: SET domain-containing protein [Patescibacteria group bacterium]
MLLIKTKIGPSKVQGIGLFADQFIPKGTVTWQYTPEYDASFTEEQVMALPEYSKERFFDYSYFDKDLKKYVLCFDDLRFINHSSKNYNILSEPRKDIASKDIEQGEELLCNYNDYEEGYFERRNMDQSRLID